MKTSMEWAVSYLGSKPRTEKEVRDYLRKKEYGDDEIDGTIEELKSYRYIDDEQYCRMYFRYGFDKGRGIARIKRELENRGIKGSMADMVYEDMEDVPDPLEEAMKIGQSVIAGIDVDGLDYDGKRKLQARIGRRVVSRGFSTETAYKVMKETVKF